MRNPDYNEHAQKIKEYLHGCGLFALTQEIRFLVQPEDQEVLGALVEFQNTLAAIQRKRCAAATSEVKPLMAE